MYILQLRGVGRGIRGSLPFQIYGVVFWISIYNLSIYTRIYMLSLGTSRRVAHLTQNLRFSMSPKVYMQVVNRKVQWQGLN